MAIGTELATEQEIAAALQTSKTGVFKRGGQEAHF